MQQHQSNAEIIVRNCMFFLLFSISHDFLSKFHSLPLRNYANSFQSFETKWTRKGKWFHSEHSSFDKRCTELCFEKIKRAAKFFIMTFSTVLLANYCTVRLANRKFACIDKHYSLVGLHFWLTLWYLCVQTLIHKVFRQKIEIVSLK